MNRRTLLAIILYLGLFWLAVAYAAFGQSDSCIITGRLYRADGSVPARGAVVKVLRTVVSGSVTTSLPREFVADSLGNIRLALPRSSTAYLYSQYIPQLSNAIGTAVPIPNTATATLRAIIPTTSVPSSYIVAVPGCSDTVLAVLADSLDRSVRTETDPNWTSVEGAVMLQINEAMTTANDAVTAATRAMDTAKTKSYPEEVRRIVRDSLASMPRVEADPVYLSEKASLFPRSDTTGLHAQIFRDILNSLHGRRDSTTINGVKGVSFTVPTVADSTMPYAFTGGAITLYRGTRFGILSLSTAAPNWLASGTTVFGLGAGSASTTGTNNTLIGNSAGNALTTGYENTFLGSRAGIRNKTGYGHTAVGDETLYSAWDGANATALGSLAGYYHAHGSGAIYLGRNAGPAVQDTGITFNYSIALGTNARPTRSNQMIIGGAGAGIDTTHIGNGVWNSTPTSVVLKSTNPLPNDGGSTPGGNVTIMAGSAGAVRSGRVQIVTGAQVRLAVDSTGTLEGNSQMRGTTTIGAGDSVQVSVPGATPTDVVMATYNVGKTALAAGDTVLSCKIWSVGTLTIFGVQNRKVSWIRIR